MFVAKHFKATRIPLIDDLLNVVEAVFAFASGGVDRDFFQEFATSAQMEPFLAKHRSHGSGNRAIAKDFLHIKLIFANQVNHGSKHHVVEKPVEFNIEGIKNV